MSSSTSVALGPTDFNMRDTTYFGWLRHAAAKSWSTFRKRLKSERRVRRDLRFLDGARDEIGSFKSLGTRSDPEALRNQLRVDMDFASAFIATRRWPITSEFFSGHLYAEISIMKPMIEDV